MQVRRRGNRSDGDLQPWRATCADYRPGLREQGVQEAVMESTAQYWRSVWLELEPCMLLHLAQAFSNRAPRGRKDDVKDAERLVRRLIADELILSFAPDGEQLSCCNMRRNKTQHKRDGVRRPYGM